MDQINFGMAAVPEGNSVRDALAAYLRLLRQAPPMQGANCNDRQGL